ncbi:hypothetical protein JAAARDRAFT_408212 [Jaapia argillacea MUCL 33604]|uniref:Uncharacterized protein n=1 Tax=Jaapia argillacea MUCL 33604 TaxID=933084 RepID=A0A067PKT8_9AGAM|nr:hypothetical protein JAAARDRAFT_408212 [Jaapia argillacea MUCL 33604]
MGQVVGSPPHPSHPPTFSFSSLSQISQSYYKPTSPSSYLHPHQPTTQDPHPPTRLSTKCRSLPSFYETGTTPPEPKASPHTPTHPLTQETDAARFWNVENGDDVEDVMFRLKLSRIQTSTHRMLHPSIGPS